MNHSHSVICPENKALVPTIVPLPVARSRMKKKVVSTETISTQNITGFLISVRGSSLRNDAQIAGTISLLSNNGSGCTLRLNSESGRVSAVIAMVFFGFIERRPYGDVA